MAAAPGLVARSARNLTRGTVLATDVEIASSFWARFMGLMGRSVLPPGHGLWIPSTNGIHMFFMRFAIDAVFLGKVELGSPGTPARAPAGGGAHGGAAGGTGASAGTPASRPIVGLRTGLPAWIGLVPLVRGADGVLELPIGTIRASGSQLGDRVQIG